MTDTTDPDTPTSDPGQSEPGLAERLIDLQAVDTAADQLRVQRARLVERERFATVSNQLTEWERRRAAYRARLDELTEAIEAAEAEGVTTLADRERLEAQMKTVIAPREAEALMHEIDAINQRRDELDDAELAALEEQATVDDQLTDHLANEPALREALTAADEALAQACAEIDNELDALAARREAAASWVPSGVLSRYDTLRGSNGVAVANLRGAQCTGCHLDLSAAEVDTAKDEAAGIGYTDCPQCGRLLVV